MSEFAQQNSISTLVARVRARSSGAPMPFASRGPVENSESGKSGKGHEGWVPNVSRELQICEKVSLDFLGT